MKRILSLVLTLAMVLSLMAGICISVGAEEYTYINGAEISGTAIPELAVGDTLPALSYSVPAGANYTVRTYWLKNSSNIEAGAVVEDGNAYTLRIEVVANDGYAFSHGFPLMINGEEYDFQPTNGRGEGFEYHMFTKDYAFLTPIEKVEVSYEAPEVGKALSAATVPAGAKYTAQTCWYDYNADSDPAVGDLAQKTGDYAIDISLIPAEGYQFTDATELWVNGVKIEDENIHYDYINYWYGTYNLGDPVSAVGITHAEPELGKTFPVPTVSGDNCAVEYYYWWDYTTEEEVAADAVVEKGHEYYLMVRVAAAAGYRFADETKVTVNGAQVEDPDINDTYVYYYSDNYDFREQITQVSLTYAEPEVGKAPGAITIPEGVNYTLAENSGWYEYSTGVKVTGNFEDGKRYEMQAELKANFGYEVSEDVVVYANGEETDDFGYGDTSVYVFRSYSFAEPVAKVELPAWPELKVGDKLPVIEGTGEHYSYHVDWEGRDANDNPLTGDTVQDNAVYYAIIYAYPDAGYEFTDDTKITQNGKAPSGWLYKDYDYIELGTVYNFGAFEMIEKVELTADIPGYGEKGGEVKIPENASYAIDEYFWGVSSDDTYEDADILSGTYQYGDRVLLVVHIDAEDGCMFSPDAVITLNGKEYEPVESDCYPDFIYLFYDLGQVKKPGATPETGDTTPVALLSFVCLSTLAGISILLSKKRIAR